MPARIARAAGLSVFAFIMVPPVMVCGRVLWNETEHTAQNPTFACRPGAGALSTNDDHWRRKMTVPPDVRSARIGHPDSRIFTSVC